MTASCRRHRLQPLEQGAALFVGVLLDDAVQIGIDVRQRGHHQRRQAGEQAAVEPAEGVAQVADGRSQDRADDVQLGCVVGAHFGGPGAGQPAAGVSPQADRRIGGQVERVRSSGRPGSRRGRGSRVRTARPTCRAGPHGRVPRPPTLRRRRRRPATAPTGRSTRGPSPCAAARTTESSATTWRRSRTGRTAPGRAARGRRSAGHDHRGHRRLGADRSCPSSGRAAGWP